MTTDLTQYARGSYQHDLLTGRANWSGSDLRGLAGRYSGRYHASRRALLARIVAAGHVVEETRVLNGNRRWCSVLVVDGSIVSRIP